MKEKFEKIKEEHPRVDVEFLEKVLTTVKVMEEKKQDTTITKIAGKVRARRNKVQSAIKWLLKYHYVHKAGQGKRIPFFVVTPKKGETDIVFGRKNIDKLIEKNMDWFKKNIEQKDFEDLKKLKKDKFSKFLQTQNERVEKHWKEQKGDNDLVKIELASKAIRYNTK